MDLAALTLAAQTASTALVTAAVSDAWEDARHKVASWFGRGQPDPGAARTFDQTRAELAAVQPAELSILQADLARDWVVRFKDAVRDHPDSGVSLATLADQLQALVPASTTAATDHSVAAGGDITISAKGGSVAAAVIHGNVSPPGPTVPGPVTSQPRPASEA